MASPSQKTLVLVLSGPAGSGKTTLCEALCSAYPGIVERLVTTTTRPPRPGERDGVDYHFLDRAAFESAIAHGAFYEWAEVHGNLYGTQKAHVRQRLAANRDILLNIDVQGAEAFRKAALEDPEIAGRLLTVFIQPRDLDQIAERLRVRGSESEESISRRLETAKREIPESTGFDHIIPSGTREEDFHRLLALYREAKARLAHP